MDIEPMRPVDHVEEPLPENWLWYTSRGWRGWILPVLFLALIVASAAIGASNIVPWWTWWVQGTAIAVIMLVTNALMRKYLQRKT